MSANKPVFQQLQKTTMDYPADAVFNTFGDFDRLVCVRTRSIGCQDSPDRMATAPIVETWYLSRRPNKSGSPRVLTDDEVCKALQSVFFAWGCTSTMDVVKGGNEP